MRNPSTGRTVADRLSFIPPQLASPVDNPPVGSGWIHEAKADGWRLQVLIEDGNARVLTRRGLDWTPRFKQIARAASRLSCRAAIIDGDAIVEGKKGDTGDEAASAAENSLVLVAFDLLHLDDGDLRHLPLTERRERLADLLFGLEGPIAFSQAFSASGEDLFAAADGLGLEGIVSKKADSPYRSGPSKTWLKAKLWDEEVFTLIGFEMDSLGYPIPLLAREHAGLFTFAGEARVGLPDDVGDRVAALQPVARAPVTVAGRRNTTWLEPVLRVRVRHRRGESGSDLRHASVIGLAKDSSP